MSNTHAISLKRSAALLAALSFLTMLTVVNFSALFGTVGAEQLQERSLTLSSSLDGDQNVGAAGSATNGLAAEHRFDFVTGPDGDDATALKFQYCTTAIGTCTTPTGLVTTSATLGATNLGGAPVLDNSANGTLVVDAAAITASTATNITFAGITNPTTIATFFVRIVTDTDDTFAGTPVDDGVVASAITEGIAITTRVVETLGFSTTGDTAGGITAYTPPGTCDALTGSGAINLGLAPDYTLDIATTYDVHSAFRIYTNASQGATVQYEGDTLRRDVTNAIDPIGPTATAPAIGSEEFGLAINLTSAIPNVDGTENTTGKLNIVDDYDGGNDTVASGAFAFVVDTPTVLGSSATTGGYIECDTYAVQYMANVSPITPSGTYTTTIVYVAVPEY